MKLMRKPYVFAAALAVLLTGFTAYVLLDTFVIPRTYSVSEEVQEQTEAQTADSTAEATEKNEPEITETSYEDDSVNINISTYREYDTDIYVADVTLRAPELLKTALAGNAYGRNITEATSEIAEQNNAILAVNGDFYGAHSKGYVLRNSKLYRSTVYDEQREDLAILADGTFRIFTEGETSAMNIQKEGAVHILAFGPALLQNGEITVGKNDEVKKATADNPRTAIAQIDELHYLFVAADGRTNESTGLTLYQLADFMRCRGAKTAYNLDGGGSTAMYFNGKIINTPTTNGTDISERSVSDIVYIGY